jgi:hypothetical protein
MDGKHSRHSSTIYPIIKRSGKMIKSKSNTTTLLLGYHHRQISICRHKQIEKVKMPINGTENFIF